MVMEKAFAKLHDNYDNIISGYTQQALSCLTGAPTRNYRHKDTPNIVDKLMEGEQNNYVMACGSQHVKGKFEDISKIGIVSSHAYTIQSVHKVHTSNGTIRLVKLRNPWGGTEWKGDWSDESDLWTDESQDQVGFTGAGNDGIFYMSETDYVTYYSNSTICYLVDDHDNSHVRMTSSAQEEKYYKVTFEEEYDDIYFLVT